MAFSVIGSIVVAVVIISITLILYVKVSRKRFQEQVKLSKTYFPKIKDFFADLDTLSKQYISKSDEEYLKHKWEAFYSEVKKKGFSSRIPDYKQIAGFLNNYKKLSSEIEKRNEFFIQNEIKDNESLLSNIDGKSLDNQQRRVVVSDEDKTLVLAGAGSGKTLTITAKVMYLCEIKKINPKEILLISFTNKSAKEMTERIQDKLGIPVEATTFHKLGLDIITRSMGLRPDVYDNLSDFVRNFFETELLNHPELIRVLMEYFIYYLEIPEDLDNHESLGELYEAEKSADLETLKSKHDRENFVSSSQSTNAKNMTTLSGERVKSLEETKIANFLFMNGINYEYEKLYPFENDDPNRKAYRPDFYLVDYDIYLEHFGITRDYKLPWLSEVEEKKYLEGIKWKREFHQKNNTKLIETYSYYTKEGILLSELKKMLGENGITLKPRDFKEIFDTIYAKKSDKYFSEFIKLCCTFIILFKSNGFKELNFELMKQESKKQDNEFLHERNVMFLDIAKIIFNQYQNFLTDNNAIDFSDMINEAAQKVENEDVKLHYKYVIVDEYQDISKSRFNLLKAIVSTSKAKLLCVGDDWQSIYRFAGSDISLFTDFEKYFGYTKLLKIEKTYRNSQELIDEASKFVVQNPQQLKKDLKSDKHLNYPLVFWGYDDKPAPVLHQIMKKIISDFGTEKTILLLGRTNYDIDILLKSGLFKGSRMNGEESLIYLPLPQVPVSFLSVHKSKGLEADNVILLNFKNDKLGFPNQISDDKVLNQVLTQNEKFIFAEERRLFYVAITRTKNRTFVLTDNKCPSIFLKDFSESKISCFININQQQNKSRTLCPRCKTGELLKVSHEKKSFIGCSNFPKCQYILNDISILANPKQCPQCGGFLVKRKGKNGHWFVGCTNYPYCEHTEKL